MNSLKLSTLVITSLIVGLVSSCGQSNTNRQGQLPGQPGFPGQPGLPGFPTGPGQCLPITGPISFSAQNIYMDFANLVGGQIPFSPQSVGQMVTGGAFVPQNNLGMMQLFGQGSDGAIQMSVSPSQMVANIPYQNYPQQSQFPNSQQYWMTQPPMQGNQMVNATGVVQLSQLVLQDIIYKVQTGQILLPNANAGINGANPQSICVSAIAINVGVYNGRIYGGNVYLYLNGTQHGYRMMF